MTRPCGLSKPMLCNSFRPSDAYMLRLSIIASGNGLSPGRHQAIIWTNPRILSIGPLGTNQWHLNRNSYIFIQENPFKNVVWEMETILSRIQCGNLSYVYGNADRVTRLQDICNLTNMHQAVNIYRFECRVYVINVRVYWLLTTTCHCCKT